MHGTFTKKQAIALLEASMETVGAQNSALAYAYQFAIALKEPKRRVSSTALYDHLRSALFAIRQFSDLEEFKVELEIPVESPILDEMQAEIKKRFEAKTAPAPAEEVKNG